MQLFSRCYDTRLTGCQIRHICYFVVSGPVVCETFLIYFVLVLTRSRSVRHNDDTVVYKQKHLSFISISDRTPSLFPRLPRGHSTQEQNSYSHISLPPTPFPTPLPNPSLSRQGTADAEMKVSAEDPQLPKAPAAEDPQLPKAPTAEDPQLPKAPTAEDPQLPKASSDEDPQLPKASSDEDPQLPKASSDEDPQLPKASSDEDPQLPKAPTAEDPQLPKAPSAEDPQLPKAPTAEDRRTVTADWYVYHCLPKVFEVWCQRRPKTGLRVLFLHDNASAHTAAITVVFLDENQVQLLPHPPYPPDLSPCDFFLLPEMKKRLKSTHLRASKMHVKRSRGLLKSYPNQPRYRSGPSGFTAWQSAYLLKEGFLAKLESFFVW